MQVITAYLLALLGGKNCPSVEDLKNILASVGVEDDDDKIELLLSQVKGIEITELIASGREKLASIPFGGGAAVMAAVSSGGGGAAPAAAESKKEEKVEEKEDTDDKTMIDIVDSTINYVMVIFTILVEFTSTFVRVKKQTRKIEQRRYVVDSYLRCYFC